MLLAVTLDHRASQSCLLQTIVVVHDRTLYNLVLVGCRWTIAKFLALRRVGFPDLLIFLKLLLGATRGNWHAPRRHLTYILEYAWGSTQAQAIAPTLIASRVTRRRRVYLLRSCKLLVNLRT